MAALGDGVGAWREFVLRHRDRCDHGDGTDPDDHANLNPDSGANAPDQRHNACDCRDERVADESVGPVPDGRDVIHARNGVA
jgi:hypothetical protein